MLTMTIVSMISAVSHEKQAVITAASYAFRSTGSTIGITLASAAFQNVLTHKLRAEYGNRPNSTSIIEHIKNSLDGVKHLPKGWDREVIFSFYMDAFRAAFLCGLGLAVLATVASLFLKEHTLHTKLSRR